MIIVWTFVTTAMIDDKDVLPIQTTTVSSIGTTELRTEIVVIMAVLAFAKRSPTAQK